MDKKTELFYKCLDKNVIDYFDPNTINIIIEKIENNYKNKLKLKYINKAKALYRGNKYRNYYNDFLTRTDSIHYSKNKKENERIKRQVYRCNYYNYYKYGRIV
jgi:hypothetical protein